MEVLYDGDMAPAQTMSAQTQTLRDLLASHRDEFEALLRSYGATRPRLFGSVARGDADKDSDIDILVDMNTTDGNILLRASGLLEDTRSLFKTNKIDIFPAQLLRRPVSDSAMRDSIELKVVD